MLRTAVDALAHVGVVAHLAVVAAQLAGIDTSNGGDASQMTDTAMSSCNSATLRSLSFSKERRISSSLTGRVRLLGALGAVFGYVTSITLRSRRYIHPTIARQLLLSAIPSSPAAAIRSRSIDHTASSSSASRRATSTSPAGTLHRHESAIDVGAGLGRLRYFAVNSSSVCVDVLPKTAAVPGWYRGPRHRIIAHVSGARPQRTPDAVHVNSYAKRQKNDATEADDLRGGHRTRHAFWCWMIPYCRRGIGGAADNPAAE
jgi:hypothetical protein